MNFEPLRWARPGFLTLTAVLLACWLGTPSPLLAQTGSAPRATVAPASADDTLIQAREALRKKDKAQLAAAVRSLNAAKHPLLQWAEYWELNNRLGEATQTELSAFFARWSGTYVEDRLRNDWLQVLGQRRDWANLRAELPRYRMNDDTEVACYGLWLQHQDGQDVRAAAKSAWYAQRDLDDGCNLLASTLVQARVFSAQDVWHKVRLAVENNRLGAARSAAALVNPAAEKALSELWDQPARYLAKRTHTDTQSGYELDLLALQRAAASDPEFAATQLEESWGKKLPLTLAATAWAQVAKQAAMKQMPAGAEHARRAWALWDRGSKPGATLPWSDDTLAWHVRAALREGDGGGAKAATARWRLVERATDHMQQPSAADQREGTWVYWKARATLALAKAGPEGDAARASAQTTLQTLASPLGFYGQLAAADLGLAPALPAAPAPLSAEERSAPRQHAGKTRALQLIALGLRNEGVREWNYSLRGLTDRQLLAAAQLACEREVWDRCVNTSERAKGEVDVAQRYPTPYRELIVARAKAEGLDAALMMGLIRQESRFIIDTRSHVGASGLMQLMPATARWTAKKVGLPFKADMINDPTLNLQLGAVYLKQVLDDFGGSAAMATAAYNAGPGRPRRWREGAVLEPAAWAETIPFNETRDYVKKVLSNAVVYTAVLGQTPLPSLKVKLGAPIGPRETTAPAPNRDLP